MRIAILVYLFPPKWLAGTEIATWNIAGQLAMKGHEVHVMTSWDGEAKKEIQENGCYIHRVTTMMTFPLDTITYSSGCLPKIRRIKPDIIHAQGISPPGMVALLAKKLLGRPYLLYCRGTDVYIRGKYANFISGPIVKEADVVVALTDDMKKEVQKIRSREVSVIPNGVDLAQFEGLPRGRLRNELHIRDEEQVISFVGTLRGVKGVQYLVKAMGVIKGRNDNIRLLLIGDGAERGELETLAMKMEVADKVNFLGKMAHEKVPGLLAASDLFVLPSLSEGFPVTILEAMAAGLPVVATRVTGIPEVIQDGKNGFLVEPGNPEEIADRVLAIFKSRELRLNMSRNNLEKAREHSWENVVRMIEQHYLNILSEREAGIKQSK